MKFHIEFLILIVHLLLSAWYAFFIFSGKSNLRKEQVLLIFFIPVFGPIVAMVIEQLNLLKRQGIKPIDLEPLGLGDDILWVTLKSFHENSDIVPLEEAIMINDVKVRRRLMLETLYTDPLKYLDVLNIAKYNDDIETSHYATTTIAKAQKDFQLSIQNLAVAIENSPDDESLLDEYLDALEKYINSGLLEEHLLRNLRIVYSKVIDRKLELAEMDRNVIIKKLRNCIDLAEFNTAFECGEQLIANWPENEDTWIEVIRICVSSLDGNKLQEIVSRMKEEKVNWTRDGKEKVQIWLEGLPL